MTTITPFEAQILNMEISTVKDAFNFHFANLTPIIEPINFPHAFDLAVGQEPIALLEQFLSWLDNQTSETADEWYNAIEFIVDIRKSADNRQLIKDFEAGNLADEYYEPLPSIYETTLL